MTRKRLAVFVDVQNIYYTTRQAFGQQFNYSALWQELATLGDIGSAFAYAIDSNNSGQKKFQDALRHIGFEVKLKPYIQRRDGSAKGDWDVGIAIDVLDGAEAVDAVVLLSGDGDFDLLLERVREKHDVKTHVYGVEALTADSLVRAADVFHPITETLLQ